MAKAGRRGGSVSSAAASLLGAGAGGRQVHGRSMVCGQDCLVDLSDGLVGLFRSLFRSFFDVSWDLEFGRRNLIVCEAISIDSKLQQVLLDQNCIKLLRDSKIERIWNSGRY